MKPEVLRFGPIGDFYIRPNHLGPNDVHEGHAHFADHLSLVTAGPVRVDAHLPGTEERWSAVLNAGDALVVKADWWHTFRPMGAPVSWFCIFHTPEHGIPAPFHAEVS